jgi:t-SNARE complex subunit (syntaxin)
MSKIDRHEELKLLRSRVKDLQDKLEDIKLEVNATINNVDSILNIDKLDLWK